MTLICFGLQIMRGGGGGDFQGQIQNETKKLHRMSPEHETGRTIVLVCFPYFEIQATIIVVYFIRGGGTCIVSAIFS